MKSTSPSVRAGVIVTLSTVLLLSVAGCPTGTLNALTGVLNTTTCQTLPTTIDSNRTLTAGCYLAEQTVTVTGGALLTIQPGVTIQFRTDAGLTVLNDGRLWAVGTAAAPIVFTGEQAVRGFWNGVQFSSSNSADNRLEYVTIQYAGGYEYFGWPEAKANLVLSGSASTPTRVSISHCTLRNSAGSGFFTDGNVTVDQFSNNTITSNAVGAGHTNASVVGFLDNASSYSGNDVDVLRVSGDDVSTTQIWAAINVPYVFTSSVTVHDMLTIEPGATLKFQAGVGLTVLTGGSLSAIGSAAKPITFTGEVAVRGAWNGLYFSSSDSPINQFDYVTVEYAGGYKFFGWDSARTNLVVNESRLSATGSTFQHSDGWGVWVSNDSTVNGDLATVNTFSDNVLGNVYVEP